MQDHRRSREQKGHIKAKSCFTVCLVTPQNQQCDAPNHNTWHKIKYNMIKGHLWTIWGHLRFNVAYFQPISNCYIFKQHSCHNSREKKKKEEEKNEEENQEEEQKVEKKEVEL